MTHYLMMAGATIAGVWVVIAPLSYWLNENYDLAHLMAFFAICMALAKLASLGACHHWNLDPAYAMCFLPR